MFYTYIIQSQYDKSYYIGHSSDVKVRLERHNLRLSRYTSKKIPWKLVYIEIYQTKGDSSKRELFLKKQRNHSFYEQLILSDSNLIHELDK